MDFDQRGIIKSKKIVAAFNFGASLQLNGDDVLEQENLSGTSKITPQKTPFVLATGFFFWYSFLLSRSHQSKAVEYLNYGSWGKLLNFSEPQFSHL